MNKYIQLKHGTAINIDWKRKSLGRYKTLEEAVDASENAEREYFPQYFNNAS